MWQAWINIIAGLWLTISSLISNVDVPANYFLLGIIITFFGFWTPRDKWQGNSNGIMGLWLILSGFFTKMQTPTNLAVSGIIVMILAVWRVYSISSQKLAHA